MRTFSLTALAVALIGLAGCGGSDLVPVSGVVMLDGTPLANANISFSPDDPGGLVATGQTDDSGRFRLKSNGTDDGVRPGKYRVLVEGFEERKTETQGMGAMMAEKMGRDSSGKQTAGGGEKSTKEINAAAKDAYKTMTKQGANKKGRVTSPIYNDIKNSPLTATVPSPEYKFELSKDAK